MSSALQAQAPSVPSQTGAALPAYCRQFAPDASGSVDLFERLLESVSDGSRAKFEAQLYVAFLADLGSRPGFTLEPIDAVKCFGRIDAIRSRGAV